MLQIRLAALALTAAALAASGCGSSKSETSTTSTAATTPAGATTASAPTQPSTTVKLATGKPLTRSKWIAKGDAICAHVNKEVAVISIRSPADYARLIPQLGAYYGTEALALSKLVPPASMAGDAARLVNGLQLLSEYLNRSGQAFRAGYAASGGQLFRTALTVQKQPIAAARRAGFKKCTATT